MKVDWKIGGRYEVTEWVRFSGVAREREKLGRGGGRKRERRIGSLKETSRGKTETLYPARWIFPSTVDLSQHGG